MRRKLLAVLVLLAQAFPIHADAYTDLLTPEGLPAVENALNSRLGHEPGSDEWIDLTTTAGEDGWLIEPVERHNAPLAGTYVLDGVTIGTYVCTNVCHDLSGDVWSIDHDHALTMLTLILEHELGHCGPDVPGGGDLPAAEDTDGDGEVDHNTCEHLKMFQRDAQQACESANGWYLVVSTLGSGCNVLEAYCRFYAHVASLANTPENRAKAADCPGVATDDHGNIVEPECVWCSLETTPSACLDQVRLSVRVTDTAFGFLVGQDS